MNRLGAFKILFLKCQSLGKYCQKTLGDTFQLHPVHSDRISSYAASIPQVAALYQCGTTVDSATAYR